MKDLNREMSRERPLSDHEPITTWGNLVAKYENRELTGWSIEQIHDLLSQIQDYLNSQSGDELFFHRIKPVMSSIFATTQILTGEAFTKNRQISLEQASHQIYLALKAICF